MPASSESVPGRLGDLVSQLSRRIRHGAKARLAPLGLTPGQGRALTSLARAGRPLRMAELAELLRIVPRSVTGVVDGLEEAGLVSRAPDPQSRRSVLVALTDRGADLIGELATARREAAEELFGGLAAADQRRLLDLLERVAGD